MSRRPVNDGGAAGGLSIIPGCRSGRSPRKSAPATPPCCTTLAAKTHSWRLSWSSAKSRRTRGGGPQPTVAACQIAALIEGIQLAWLYDDSVDMEEFMQLISTPGT